LKRREKQCIGSKLYSIKTQCKKVKKVTRSNQQGVYSSKMLDVKAKRKTNWLTKSLSRRATEANPKKCNCGGFFGQKEAGALFPRENSVIALCVRLLEALAL
jgi:hypothetical protein